MSTLKCANCGSSNLQVKAWVDANNGLYISDVDSNDPEDTWCPDCEEHAGTVIYIDDDKEDSGEFLSDSWLERADNDYERIRDEK
jgi:hypothetical protein